MITLTLRSLLLTAWDELSGARERREIRALIESTRKLLEKHEVRS